MVAIFNKQYLSDKLIWLLVFWQLISVLLMGLGVWPQNVAWINFGLLALFCVLMAPFEGLLAFVISAPFYVALPNPYFESLPTWRPLLIILFAVWLVRLYIRQRHYVAKLFSIRRLLELPRPGALVTLLQRVDSRFMWWDKYLGIFLAIACISLIFARYRAQSLKQIIFLLNAYLVYILVINVVTTKQQVRRLVLYVSASLAMIVALGYAQLIATFFSSQYYFWQYWALMISKVYYGLGLSNVLAYSNSWFSYVGDSTTLRMFSIMPDSHSFGLIAVMLMAFLLALIFLYPKKDHESIKRPKSLLTSKNYYLWYAMRFSGLAVIFSGTRGLWVGMLPAMFVAAALYWKDVLRPVMKKALLAFALVIFFFIISPFINQALNWFRVSMFEENFLDRAASIYDLGEESNAGRLIIWKDSLVYSVKHPFGVGYGNFIVSLVPDIPEGTPFEKLAELPNRRYNLPQKFVTAHSLYLNILVELGVAGLLAFGLFIFEWFLQAGRFLWSRRHRVNFYSACIAAMGLLFVWTLAYGIFDVTIFNDKVLLYLFVALGLSGLVMRRAEAFEGKDS